MKSAGLFLLPALATAQLLQQGIGNLPSCGSQCTVLTQAQQSCNGGSSTDLAAWTCFCKAVWTNSAEAITTMCSTSCPNPSDNTAISQWYTQNCGADNGLTAHGGGSSNSGGSGTAPSSSGAPSSGASSTADSGTSASDADAQVCSDWFSCHWKWVVMIIVLAVGLTILGVGGRWWKKRHDRKRDAISGGFNQGITTREAPTAGQDPHMSGEIQPAGGRDSPMRTRDNFMPYGYGYTRSESRLGSNTDARGSPLARGATPVNDLEKGAGEEAAPRKKSRRVLVRERSGEEESEKIGR